MKARLLNPEPETFAVMGRLLGLPHVIENINGAFTGYFAVWRLFREIEEGKCLVFGAFNEDGRCAGAAFGQIVHDQFVTHLLFERHAEAVSGCLEMMKSLRRNFPAVRAVAASVPEENRAVRLLMRKLGFRPLGEEGGFYLWRDGLCKHTEKYLFELKEL